VHDAATVRVVNDCSRQVVVALDGGRPREVDPINYLRIEAGGATDASALIGKSGGFLTVIGASSPDSTVTFDPPVGDETVEVHVGGSRCDQLTVTDG
jgi:hypothetical protein